jgi:hypothetical protein
MASAVRLGKDLLRHEETFRPGDEPVARPPGIFALYRHFVA